MSSQCKEAPRYENHLIHYLSIHPSSTQPYMLLPVHRNFRFRRTNKDKNMIGPSLMNYSIM
jgi:hypothetical protein